MNLRSRLCCLLFLLPAAAFADKDLPDEGYSLFDRLFSKSDNGAWKYDIPYPFETLLERLEERLGSLEAGESPLVASLIPRGRSLQREAAKPEYYRFPRVVVAVDQDTQLPLLAKNRLFLGYQEKARVIEVISYNERDGRFEFQIVEDYAEGLQPRVTYASRDLCTSCHQNDAPIFARPRWRETNFNNDVAERIAAEQQHYHGIPAMADKGDAARFDFATDQAGLFNAYQQVWQQGCDGSDDEAVNRACRAGLFLASLQHAIASIPRPQYRSALIEENLVPLMQSNWQRRWPEGMPVASADIADRESPPGVTVDRISASQDPLNLRAPLASWSYRPALRRSIQGIGEQFLLLQDLVRLNQHLLELADSGSVPQRNLDGHCYLGYSPATDKGRWINIDCRFPDKNNGGIAFEGELWHAREQPQNHGRGNLLISGTAGWARVEVASDLRQRGDGNLRLELRNSAHFGAARLWDNRIVSHFEIELAHQPVDERRKLQASIRLSDDLGVVEKSIHALLQADERRSDELFGNHPIRGQALMRALLAELGAAAPPLEVALPSGLERKRPQSHGGAEAPVLAALPPDAPLRLVFRHCAECHVAATQTPPGFLHGNIARVETQLRQCAPRIALRLAMWQQDRRERAMSPMPPPRSLAARHADERDWLEGDDFKRIREYIHGLGPVVGELTAVNGYQELPHCLGDQARVID